MTIRDKLQHVVGEAFFRDHARPIEWVSLLYLGVWLQFLLTRPEVFASPRYTGFSALSPAVWAAIIGVILSGQLVAMWPSRYAPSIRFAAMAMAAAIWTVIALSFWAQADTAPLSARGNTVLALAAAVTAVYLGLRRGGS